MFRDFQSRNILVSDDQHAHFIDFQGGMKGAPQYDVASMIWQARANLPDEWKNNLLEDYMNLFERKAQFLTSIPLALRNLKWFFEYQSLGIVLPEFKRVLTICTDDEIMER